MKYSINSMQFIGRTAELATFCELLNEDFTHESGLGGIGKSTSAAMYFPSFVDRINELPLVQVYISILSRFLSTSEVFDCTWKSSGSREERLANCSSQRANKVDEKDFHLELIRLVKAIIRQLKTIIRCLLGIRLADHTIHTPRQIVFIRRYASHEAQRENEDSRLHVWWLSIDFFGATSGMYTFSSAA